MNAKSVRIAFAITTLAVAALAASCSEDPVEPEPTVLATDFDPTWSPVADTIAFVRSRATSEGPAGIYLVGSDGGVPRLVSPGEFHELRYDPTGQRVATAVHGNLVTILVATDTRTLVLVSEGPIHDPDWSPDGTRIVYGRGGGTSRPADSTGIHIVDLTTGVNAPMRDALGVPIQGYQPAWSPRDSLIAFVRDNAIDVWNARTFATTRLLTPPSGYAESNPVWIEDGARLLVVEAGASYRTVVLDIDTKQPSAWPIYAGPLRAIAPLDSAFVYRDVDSTLTDPPVYVLYRRGLTDVAGATIRQLTHYLP